MDSTIYEKCPNCGETMVSEGVDVGIGYVYPPFHCSDCGYNEGCERKAEPDVCKHCNQNEYCGREG